MIFYNTSFYKQLLAMIVFASIASSGYALPSSGKSYQPTTTCNLKKMPIIYESVLGVTAGKTRKIPKESIVRAINRVAKDSWTQRFMREVLDEVYDYPALDPQVYTTYRGELCYWQSITPDKKITSEFKQANPLLEECSNGDYTSKERTLCAMKVVHKIFNIDAK